MTQNARFRGGVPKILQIDFLSFHIFATQARWWKFGFSSAFKLNRLSGLTDPGSNIKSEKRRLLASFLFFPNIQSQILNHFWWGFIFRSVFLLRSVPIFYLYLKLQALRVCFVFIKLQSATQPLDPPAFPLSPVILVWCGSDRSFIGWMARLPESSS